MRARGDDSRRDWGRGEPGFVLVAALWLLAALAALASIYATYAGDVGLARGLHEDEVRFEAAERAALELTALRVGAYAIDRRPGQGVFRFETGGASVEVAFVSEGARIDLNGAPEEMLAKLFAALGAPASSAADYAHRVVAWRRSGAASEEEATAYKAAGYPYEPRRAPFQDVLELSLVRDTPQNLVAAALPYLTVFNPAGQVDIRVADPLALSALPKLDPQDVSRLLDARGRPDFDAEAYLGKLGPARAYATASGGGVVRVNVQTALRNGRRSTAQIVIVATPEESEPYRILSWSDL